MSHFNFDEKIERNGTNSVKWDFHTKFALQKSQEPETEDDSSRGEIIQMWVADMDFRCPQPIQKALEERSKHPIFGYSWFGESFFDATINWFQRRHQWKIERKSMMYSIGVVPSMNVAIRAFTRPGDKVIIQSPVYYPFAGSIENNGRIVLENPLRFDKIEGRYTMDFDDLEQKVKDRRARLALLCNPHNPVGRAWTKEELERFGEICLKHSIVIVSDEIWCDLVIQKEKKYTPLASISPQLAQNSVSLISPTKTFNLAGLGISQVVISNPTLRNIYQNEWAAIGMFAPNIYGPLASQIAYNECEDWLEALLVYLRDNVSFLRDFLNQHMPNVRLIEPEATYLVWLDCSALNYKPGELFRLIKNRARVITEDGEIFGSNGRGFIRINIACDRNTLNEALKRIQSFLSQDNSKL